jgi:perosamine synthetase
VSRKDFDMNPITIPVYRPDLTGNEKQYVLDCLESGWISSKGEYVARFEAELAAYLGIAHCALVSNGTTAIQTALGALGIGPGDEVIVPTLTYIASVNPIVAAGATPVFVDSCADTWQMDVSAVARKVTPRTRAILAVHLYGGMCDMSAITALARERELLVIEDCAEAFGSRLHGKTAGTLGDVACFSFYGNKTITTGEGGLVATSSAAIHKRVLSYKGQGLADYREYWHDKIGFNYRMTNLCAAIGLAQLERIDDTLSKKRGLAEWYQEDLRGQPVCFQTCPEGMFHTYWMVSVVFDDERTKNLVRQQLDQQGIETRPFFNPVHTMPMYAGRYQDLPHAQDLASRGINLPSWPALSRSEVSTITLAVKKAISVANTSNRIRIAA